MLYFKEYFDFDESVKDVHWADKLITHFRSYWKPIINTAEAKEGMEIILSKYSMEDIKKMFKDPDPNVLGFEILRLSIMEKVRNILCGELARAGITTEIRGIDPASEDERERDKTVLKNRNEIESLMTYLNKSIGGPEYKLSDRKEKAYKGNVEMFDALGLSTDEDYQVSYFFQIWHQLLHEIDAQKIIDYCISHNELPQWIEYWINDILAKKAITMQVFVNEMSGAIDMRYMSPEHIWSIPGSRDDCKDAVCLGFYEDGMTVSKAIQMMGNSFNMERDYMLLINSVRYSNTTPLTGVWDTAGNQTQNGKLYGTEVGATCSMSEFLQFKVSLGYIEWKSWNATGSKMGVDYHGNLREYPVSVKSVIDSLGLNNGGLFGDMRNHYDSDGYTKELYCQQCTYRAYFISSSYNSQYVFKFGKLYHQELEGAEDEYSNYSIIVKKKPGPTLAQIAKPWLRIAMECFHKFRWFIRYAKPKGRSYLYESLVKIGKHMINSGNVAVDVQAVLKMMKEGIDEIHTIPEKGGQPVGGGSNPNFELPNGLDPTAIEFQHIIDWAVNNISADYAIAPLRAAESFKPNAGLKLQQEAKAASENATYGVGEMLDTLLTNGCQKTLTLAQDIIFYQESKPYAFLERVISSSGIKRMQDLGKVAMHRYSLFVGSFTQFASRQKIMQDTEIAFRNKEITYDIKMLIDSIKDWKKAGYVLAFERLREQKELQKEQALAHQRQMEIEQAQTQREIAIHDTDGKWRDKAANTTGQWQYRIAELNNHTKEDMGQQKASQRADELNQKTDSDIKKDTVNHSLAEQSSLPA